MRKRNPRNVADVTRFAMQSGLCAGDEVREDATG